MGLFINCIITNVYVENFLKFSDRQTKHNKILQSGLKLKLYKRINVKNKHESLWKILVITL